MSDKLLTSKEDMAWLSNVHFDKKLSDEFMSAILYGNEDFPDRIDTFRSAEPKVGDYHLIWKWDVNRERYIVNKIVNAGE
ncbi:MAG: hypothetical protein KGH64_05450 [Candidatus Micrarchaeota archaeon]|nr:hypothetical protein [Candidatus Micrarchaeota archaeon]